MSRACDRHGVTWPRHSAWRVFFEGDPLRLRALNAPGSRGRRGAAFARGSVADAILAHLREPSALPWPAHPDGGLWPGQAREAMRLARWLLAQHERACALPSPASATAAPAERGR